MTLLKALRALGQPLGQSIEVARAVAGDAGAIADCLDWAAVDMARVAVQTGSVLACQNLHPIRDLPVLIAQAKSRKLSIDLGTTPGALIKRMAGVNGFIVQDQRLMTGFQPPQADADRVALPDDLWQRLLDAAAGIYVPSTPENRDGAGAGALS